MNATYSDRASRRQDSTGEEDPRAEDDAELVERAKECYRIGIDASAEVADDALEDLNFLAGEQWDPTSRAGATRKDARPSPSTACRSSCGK
jgi:hypothetical protein